MKYRKQGTNMQFDRINKEIQNYNDNLELSKEQYNSILKNLEKILSLISKADDPIKEKISSLISQYTKAIKEIEKNTISDTDKLLKYYNNTQQNVNQFTENIRVTNKVFHDISSIKEL